MARYLLYITIACFLFANCTGNNAVNSPGKIITSINDSFYYYGDDMVEPVGEGFSIDTIRKPDTNSRFRETIIVPRLTSKEYSIIDAMLQQEIIKRKDSAAEISAGDDTVNMKEVPGKFYNEIKPLSVFKSNDLISYGFLDISNDEFSMRPFRKYFSVNYNTQQDKFIFFDDYFILKNRDDSSFLKWIIYSDIAGIDISPYVLGNGIVFSSDKENLYFYFSQFGFANNPCGIVKGVKRKLIRQFIREEYK